MAKEVTRAQAATKKAQAAELMERTGQPDRAEEFRSMSVEEYAEHRGHRLTNPKAGRGFMAGETKGELSDKIDEIESLIDEALDAELSREEVIARTSKCAMWSKAKRKMSPIWKERTMNPLTMK